MTAHPESFRMDVRHQGARVEVALEGELDAYSAPRLRDGMAALGELAGRHVVLDLTGIGFVDSAGLATIVSSLRGVPKRYAYGATKAAVIGLTKAVAADFIREGIRCNCICPARVQTPFVDGYLREHYPGREDEMRRALEAYQPIGRMGTPDEVAALALYLCSDEAAFVTGQAYPIDGGVLVS